MTGTYADGYRQALTDVRAAVAALDTTPLTDSTAGVIATGRTKRAALAAIDQLTKDNT